MLISLLLKKQGFVHSRVLGRNNRSQSTKVTKCTQKTGTCGDLGVSRWKQINLYKLHSSIHQAKQKSFYLFFMSHTSEWFFVQDIQFCYHPRSSTRGGKQFCGNVTLHSCHVRSLTESLLTSVFHSIPKEHIFSSLQSPKRKPNNTCLRKMINTATLVLLPYLFTHLWN